MLIQLILFLLFGILAGTFTGLVPGIHINLVASSVIAFSYSIFSEINSIYLVVFIVAMSIAHVFIDFIPSVFLGCPDTDTELSVLPGHEMLKQGFGFQAVFLTALGGIIGIIIFVLISFPFILIIQKIYNIIKFLVPYILIIRLFGRLFSSWPTQLSKELFS